jgi:HEAT repeat protein
MKSLFALLFIFAIPLGFAADVKQMMIDLQSKNTDVKRAALKELDKNEYQNNNEIIEPLLQLILRDQDFILQDKAANILIQHKSPTAVNGLVNILQTPAAGNGHDSAAYGLSRSKNPRAVEPLLAAINHRSDRVRKYAVDGLTDSVKKDQRIADAIFKRATGDDDFIVRSYAARAVAQNGNNQMIDRMIATLSDPKVIGRGEIAEALGNAEKTAAIPALIELMKSNNTDLQKNAVKGLINFKDERLVQPMLDLVRKPKADMIAREYSIRHLADMGDVRANSLFLEIVTNAKERETVKQYAIEGLGKTGGIEALHPLIGFLGSENKYTRRDALKSIQLILAKNPTLQARMQETLQCLPQISQRNSAGESEVMYFFNIIFFGGLPLLTATSAAQSNQIDPVSPELIRALQDLLSANVG